MNQQKSRTTLILSVIVIVLIIVSWSVYAFNQSQNRTPETSNVESNTTQRTDPADRAAPTPSERVTITATNDGFVPRDITVKRGTIITVKNESSDDIQFSSDDHPSHRDNREMNLKTLSRGESTSYTALTPGTWGYHDHLNDNWTGSVTVEE